MKNKYQCIYFFVITNINVRTCNNQYPRICAGQSIVFIKSNDKLFRYHKNSHIFFSKIVFFTI